MPRKESVAEPKVCPSCKSPYWDRPRIKQSPYVNLHQIFKTKRLRYRASARQVVESLPKGDASIVIDFANIEFASRSFLHELLRSLGNRKVTFENKNADVEKMIEIVERKALVNQSPYEPIKI
jgi:hypothetical protein